MRQGRGQAHDHERADGWLAEGIAEDLSAKEQEVLRDAVELMRRLADS
ncbi:MAG: hypothetical protein ACJ76V_13225 [Thermoleophilaceae bacterium]